MDSEGAIANMRDLIRLAELERQGYFKPGFAALSTIQASRYVARIVALRAFFRVVPYPGPIVSE
jgi:hypothetical protein